jgi:hypothetical protein
MRFQMNIPKRIIHRISRIIKDTTAPYSQTLPDTQRHLLPQILLCMLTASSVYTSDVARKMGAGSMSAREMDEGFEVCASSQAII